MLARFATKGVLVGALTLAGAAAAASGYPLLGAFLSDPNTAATLTTVVVGVGALVAGALGGVKKPAQ